MAKSKSHRFETQDPSARLGKYTLIQHIATGGMAEIFVAKSEGFAGADRLCVIKRILPRFADDPKAVQMFLDEARIAATLQHPNIVQMYEVGEMDGNYFIAMEYLHGEDARTMMKANYRRGADLPMEHALHILIGLCSGLQYAHDKRSIEGKPLNIVHRDISPHNVFITYDGGVKVVDFGIAKASNRQLQTQVETLKGKIQYMSPEQCRCLDIDRRSDVYALGIILYELTTGERLNAGEDDYEIMKRTVEGPVPSPSEVADNYPPQLEQIVQRALQKHPDDRYQSTTDMQEDIESYSHEARLRRSNRLLAAYMANMFEERIRLWDQGMADGTQIRAMIAKRHLEGSASVPTGAGSNSSTEETAYDVDIASERTHLEPGLTGDYSVSGELGRQTNRLGWAVAIFVAAAVGGVALAVMLRGPKEKVTAAAPAIDDRAADPSQGGANELDPKVTPDLPVQDPTQADPIADPDPVDPDPDVSSVDDPPPRKTDKPVVVRRFGSAALRATPKNAKLFVDGVAYRAGLKLKPGSHRAVAKLDGYTDAAKSFGVQAGKTARVKLTLRKKKVAKPADPVATGPGELRVASKPSCQVIIDGTSRGFTNMAIKLKAGRHKVRLVNKDFGIDQTYTVTILAGKVTKKRYSFTLSGK